MGRVRQLERVLELDNLVNYNSDIKLLGNFVLVGCD